MTQASVSLADAAHSAGAVRTTAPPADDVQPAPARLVDPELHATGDPHAVWRWMRGHAPLCWHPPTELPGFWSVTRYDDVRAVYRDPRRFSSAGGGQTIALTDPPRHKQLRVLIADWFNERSVRSLEDSIRATVRALLAQAVERGECDFALDVAARLSLYVICALIGVPPQDREDLFRWTNEAFEATDPVTEGIAHQRVMQYFLDLIYRRMAEPADDLVSALTHGTVDGELLTEQEVLLNCENLLGATENGRLSLIGGMLAFLQHPEQWRRLGEDRGLLPGAVEEILRWTSSATHSMRTATEPVVLHGQRIEAGDRVVVWIPSANRDETVFPDPDRFDVARSPNRHLALGAGEHFCMGSTLARAELRILYSELLDSVGRVEQRGPAVLVRSIAVAGPEHLPVRMIAS